MPAEEEPRVFTADETQDDINQVMQLEWRVGLPSLRSCDRAKLRVELGNINETVKRIKTHNITDLNSLLYAAS